MFEYDYVAAKTFFQNRGIGRYRLLDTKLWTYIHLEPPVVRTIDVEDARDFMFAFAEQNCSRLRQQPATQGELAIRRTVPDVKARLHPTELHLPVP